MSDDFLGAGGLVNDVDDDGVTSLLAQARELVDQTTLATETEAVIADRYDKIDYRVVHDSVPVLDRAIYDLSEQNAHVEDAYGDLFQALHQPQPALREPTVMDERYRPNRDLIDEVQNLPEFEELREYTVNDGYATAAAMMSLEEPLKDIYSQMRGAKEQAEQARKDAEEAAQKAKDAFTLCQGMGGSPSGDQPGQPGEGGEGGQPGGEGGQPGAGGATPEQIAAAQQAIAEAMAAQQAAQQSAGQAAQQSQQSAQQAAAAIAGAAAQTANDIDEENGLVAGFGLEEGEVKRMDFAQRRQLAAAMRGSRLAKFAGLIGQFKAFAEGERRKKVPEAIDYIVGAELGDDLTKLISREYEELADETTELLFWDRYSKRELWQHQTEGTERMGRGPIVVVCDESGSMDQEAGGGWTCEAWSKALSLALLDSARKEGRDFTYIGFGSRGQQYRIDFPKGEPDVPKIMTFVEHFFAGGTSYYEPLEQARTLVEEYADNGKPRPDIVFITDANYGQMDPDWVNEWAKTRDKTSMMTYGILLGNGGSAAHGVLSQVCGDSIRSLGDLTDPKQVADILRNV